MCRKMARLRAIKKKGGRRKKRSQKGRKRGRGGMAYNASTTKRRRTPRGAGGRGFKSILKDIGKFAAKNAPHILKGARYLADKTGNKTVKNVMSSSMLDKGADEIVKRFGSGGGRGGNMQKSKLKRDAFALVKRLLRRYGNKGTRKILMRYVKSITKAKGKRGGRGNIGESVGKFLGSLFPW